MAFTRFATSEPWDPASGERLNKLGDELQEQINVLSKKVYSSFGELGQGFSQNTPFTTIENAMANGSALIASTYMPDSTNLYPSVSGTLIINKAVNNRTKLEFVPYTGGCYFGYMDNGFKGWEQIATTTKTSFLCTAKPGCAITNQDCYVLNGIAYINIDVVKSDGTVFGVSQHGLFSSPYFKAYNIPINAIFTDGVLVAPMMYNGGLWNDGGCYITISSATAKKITVKCEVTL